ncbi:odorant receptor 131-2-like [Thalassophryne amazonica]|uniref:odorant receptor 131-2-like n=1 Tax=Thalassophryne amazonica TaxID=390379 RepID=UPI0014719ED2|nr:odorant receptor 131-2-like [Thalassophryne amazonica]
MPSKLNYGDLKESLDSLAEDVSAVKTQQTQLLELLEEVKQLRLQNEEKNRRITELEQRVEELEQHSRMNDVVISEIQIKPRSYTRAVVGGGEEPSEQETLSVKQQVASYLQSRGIELDLEHIEACHTLRQTGERPTVIVFYTNPWYIPFIHLVINDTIQLTVSVILFILTYTMYNNMNASFCCILMLIAIFTTENTPLNLACMAVECYIAVCLPLHHTRICTVKRTRILIGVIWIISTCSVLPDLFVTLATEHLSFFHSKVLCLREIIFPNTYIIRKRDIMYPMYLITVGLVIVYTYFKIVFVAKTTNKDARKARNTILLHGVQLMLCMGSYIMPMLSHAIRQWFPKHFTDSIFAGYIVVQILPRTISPFIYGIRDNTFRMYFKKHLFCQKSM